jgi:cobalt-zinc-cadmium efflux system outer membrane protein
MLPTVLMLAAGLAADPPASKSITFDAALGLSERTPSVVGTGRAAREKATLDRNISSVPYNPQVSVMPGWRFAPKDEQQMELVVEVVQPWNLSGQSRARRQTVALEESVLVAEARFAALASRLAAARAWINVWAAEHVLDETRREERIAAELERLVERATSLGAMTRADLAESRAYHAEARAAVLNAEGELFQSGLGLGREVGAQDALPLLADGPLPDAPTPPAAKRDLYVQQMALLPAVTMKELQARAAAAREVEEKAARGTVAQFGAVLQRDAPNGLVLSGLARLTFPIFEHAERERATMRADQVRLEGEQAEALLAARFDLAASFHEVDHTAELLAVVRDDLAPASREAAETRRKIFENGGATLLEVLQSDRAAVVAASRLWRIRAEHAWARARLWLLLTEVALHAADREAAR